MNRKKVIRKIMVLSAWFLVLSGMTTLLLAANRKQKTHVCTELLIGIKGSGEKYFVEKDDVVEMIEKASNGSVINQQLTQIDLKKIEKALLSNSWISEAELYFDSKDALHVSIEEREPVARIFTTGGYSFYIDTAGHKMPLLEKTSLRLPVVTGFTNARKWNKRDSVVLNQLKAVIRAVHTDKFWSAQTGQIDITFDKKFELVPVVGGHIIRLGDAENIDDKLKRLETFYKQVMSKAGLNKYAALDVQFAGQVVAVKRGATSVIDSIQLEKNIKELLDRASMENIDEDMLPSQNIIQKSLKDSTVSTPTVQRNSVSTKTNPNPSLIRQSNPSKPKTNSKPIERPKEESRRAKAVMKGT